MHCALNVLNEIELGRIVNEVNMKDEMDLIHTEYFI